jgi:hypothetical protein
MLAHCYTTHCTPGSFPYDYKRKVQGPLTEGWPRGEGRDGARVSRSLPPAWTLVTPYCKRTRPGRGTNTKAAGFPFLRLSPSGFLPPSRSVSRRPIWAGARGDNLLVGPGTPRVRNADRLGHCKDFHCTLVLVYLIPSSYLCSYCFFALN